MVLLYIQRRCHEVGLGQGHLYEEQLKSRSGGIGGQIGSIGRQKMSYKGMFKA